MPQLDDSQWRYRPLEIGDIELLLLELPYLLGSSWTRENLVNLYHEQGTTGSHQVRVLCDVRQVVGFAEFVVVLDECHLLNIAVLKKFQGLGLGRYLLAKLLADAAGSGCVTCLLEVRNSNLAAIRMYEAAGFVRVGIRKDYYPAWQGQGSREDAILFNYPLD